MKPSVNVIFIIDDKRSEAQACILVPTLKRFLTSEQKAIAYVPESYWPEIKGFSRDIFERSGIEVHVLPPAKLDGVPIWSEEYPLGDKIIAAAQPRKSDVTVYLNTDMILTQPCDFAAILGEKAAAAVANATGAAQIEDTLWEEIYSNFKLPVPQDKDHSGGDPHSNNLPFFNSSMVIFKEDVIAYGERVRFSEVWLGVASEISHKFEHSRTKGLIDQIALSVAAYLIAAPIKALDAGFDHNLKDHPLQDGDFPEIVRYSSNGILWACAHLSNRTLDCLCDVMGPDAARDLATHHLEEIKRKRLKRYFIQQ